MAKSKSARRTVLDEARSRVRQLDRSDWARRHPARAAEERSFITARAELLTRWAHKNDGTAETHEAHSRRQSGAVARLHASGHLNDDEVAWAQEIAAAAERIMKDALVRTASLETRVDGSRHGDAFFEALGSVWSEMTYGRWRAALGPQAALVLDIVVHDVGLARAASAHGMHARRARRLLTDALALWARVHRQVRDEVTPADLLAAQAAIL